MDERTANPQALSKLQVKDLGPVDGVWTIEYAKKANVLAQRFFQAGPSTPEFHMQSERHCHEVEEWLAEDWEDIPPITMEEVQCKLLEMRALAAPGPDGIMTQCLQASRAMLIPCLTELFSENAVVGSPPCLLEDCPSPNCTKTGRQLACRKGLQTDCPSKCPKQGCRKPNEGPHELHLGNPLPPVRLSAGLVLDSFH